MGGGDGRVPHIEYNREITMSFIVTQTDKDGTFVYTSVSPDLDKAKARVDCLCKANYPSHIRWMDWMENDAQRPRIRWVKETEGLISVKFEIWEVE
jgi:hypothetical protein